jgi:uncharacterized membrane protein YkoI
MIRPLLIVSTLWWSLLTNASADPVLYERAAAAPYQASGISLDQAIAMVQAKYGAKVMRANSVDENGRTVHYIRLMTQDRSRVWTVRVDAMTGREF